MVPKSVGGTVDLALARAAFATTLAAAGERDEAGGLLKSATQTFAEHGIDTPATRRATELLRGFPTG